MAVNALWPRTLIATDALNMIPGVQAGNGRTPAIMADAAHAVLVRRRTDFQRQFLIDDEVLREAGVTDLSRLRDRSVAAAAARPVPRLVELPVIPAKAGIALAFRR